MVAFSQSLQVYACKDVNIVVDTRRMTHKNTPDGLTGTGSVLHPHCNWEKGHQVYMFLEEKCLCSFIIPLIPTRAAIGGAMEDMPLSFDGMEYELQPEAAVPTMKEAAVKAEPVESDRKRSKRGEN